MDFEKIGVGILTTIIAFFFIPRLKEMVKNSPKAKKGDWGSVLLPIGFVVLFVILLVMMVR